MLALPCLLLLATLTLVAEPAGVPTEADRPLYRDPVHDGTYHLYLTHVPGVFADWNHPRSIVHLTSDDLRRWEKQSTLKLNSKSVIDGAVLRLPDGRWRMFYNDEPDKKAVRMADSDDLFTWCDVGKAYDGPASEGPVAFAFEGRFWLIVDEWKGLGVYRSDDAETWTRQDGPNLLVEPGTGPDDGVRGSHPDVVVSDGRAYLFYFTHPEKTPGRTFDDPAVRRSSIHVTELRLDGDRLACDRDSPTWIALQPPVGD